MSLMLLVETLVAQHGPCSAVDLMSYLGSIQRYKVQSAISNLLGTRRLKVVKEGRRLGATREPNVYDLGPGPDKTQPRAKPAQKVLPSDPPRRVSFVFDLGGV